MARAKGWKPKEHGANPGGRPKIWNQEAIENLADEMESFYEGDFTAMLLEDFCASKKIPLEYLSRFASESEKFSQAKKVVESIITSRLFKAAGAGEIHPSIGIFGLKNSGTKWRDKQEVEHSGEVKGSGVIEIHLPAKRE